MCLIAAALALQSTPAACQVVDSALWVADGVVNAIARDGNTIYIGGYFTQVGPPTGGGVSLSATTGVALTTFPRVAGSVYASASDGSGGWYIGGAFESVGDLPRSNLAHILVDGSVTDWSPAPNGRVYALVLNGGEVCVGEHSRPSAVRSAIASLH